MNPSRRDLIVGLTAAGLTTACGDGGDPKDSSGPTSSPAVPAPDRAPEPAAWQAPGALDSAAFAYGVTVGDATESAALIHVRTAEAGCTLVAMAAVDGAWVEVARVDGLDPDGRAVRHELTGLDADTGHAIALYAADGTRRSAIGRLRTAPAAGAPSRKLVLGATSCWGSANPQLANLSAIAARQPDAILLLGDTVYADGSQTVDDYRGRWDTVLAKEHPQALFASASVIATWDDHEVENNWTLGQSVNPDQFIAAKAAFREAIPQREGPGGEGFWRVHALGDIADVFVLDSRGERIPGRIASDQQITEMAAAIRASQAHFKIVLCSVHLTDHTAILGPVEDDDRWQGYPDQRQAIVAACEETPGTFVITGDMHYSAVQILGLPGEPGEDVVEIAAGPAGSGLFPLAEVVALATEPPPQYTWVGDRHTGTVLTLDPGTGEVHAEFLDDAGELVFSHRWTP